MSEPEEVMCLDLPMKHRKFEDMDRGGGQLIVLKSFFFLFVWRIGGIIVFRKEMVITGSFNLIMNN